MHPPSQQPAPFSRSIDRLLSRLRRRIRIHVLLDGIATIAIWLVVAFGILLILDYLPVRFGLPERSRLFRQIGLAVIGIGVLAIFFLQILRRVFVRLKSKSIALLVERHYPQFNESLVTAVEQREHPDPLSSLPMQQRTESMAESLVSQVDMGRLFNTRRLGWKLAIAGLLVSGVVGFSLAQSDFASLARRRLLQLESTPWPRRCHLEMVGIKVASENPVDGIAEMGQTRLPVDNTFKVARGARVTLLVRAADSGADARSSVPPQCRFLYSTQDGSSGSLTMSRIGAPRNGFQLFSIDASPLNGILNDIDFTIRGGDHRIGPFRFSVVPSPSVITTELACEFPPYMVDTASGRWMPRTIPWTGQSKLPVGTTIEVRSTTNKPIRKVYLRDVAQQTVKAIAPDGDSFHFSVGTLTAPIQKEIYLCDTDGIVSEQPFSLTIEPIEDQPPTLRTRMIGIGTAVTPDVRIPFQGTIEDDYGVAAVWLDVGIGEADPVREPLTLPANKTWKGEIDFLEKRRAHAGAFELVPGDEHQLSLVIRAEDRYNLGDAPHVGFGDKYVLDIVTPNQLLRILERLEVAQRRRLEQIYLELGEARNLLLRTTDQPTRTTTPVEPGDAVEPGDTAESAPSSQRSDMQLLFAQRTLMQINKSKQEISGIAHVFENIRLQLIHNRIDSEDRKRRISDQIVTPLQAITDRSIPALQTKVTALESALQAIQEGTTPPDKKALATKTEDAMKQHQVVMNELNLVLDALIKYETQNELLEVVRRMIKQQEAILEETKKLRQKNAFKDLLD